MTLPDGYQYVPDNDPGVCLPWQATMACCDEWDTYDADLQLRAQSLAWNTMRALSGRRVGGCPVTLRPCLSDRACSSCFGGSWLSPLIDANGNWVNNANRASGNCSCCTVHSITLPGSVAMVTDINIDGWHLDLSLVRVDNGNELIRLDGCKWPSCQNLSANPGDLGTVTITYLPGLRPDSSGLWAAGLLACEFAKACTGGKCRLPRAVTSVARQGVTMEFSQGMFESGTGIQEVDAYIEMVNPHGQKSPPVVWSPDLQSAKHHVTTWSGYDGS